MMAKTVDLKDIDATKFLFIQGTNVHDVENDQKVLLSKASKKI
jgi:hypothetical protein